MTDRLHLTVGKYVAGKGDGCDSCHTGVEKNPYDHADIVGGCAMCHDVGNAFAALPKDNFNHPPTAGADCSNCHQPRDWKDATPANAHDPSHDIMVTAQLPTYAGQSIVTLTSQDQTLSMTMNHGAVDVPPAAISDCQNCHGDAANTNYYPGSFHSALANLDFMQPASCDDCHTASMPKGFVGPAATNPARTPSSGEMKHDAVAWSGNGPTSTSLVPADCSPCHRAPSDKADASWATSKTRGMTALYHAALTAAGLPQPTSCIDCHANTRPSTLLTSSNTGLPAGLQLDHSTPTLQADCVACHNSGGSTQWTSWKSGKFHIIGGGTPPTCLPCHAGERPTSTTSWTNPTYKSSPFDYVPNAAGATHGNGKDCLLCHIGPGTGAWGVSQNWADGRFTHGGRTDADDGCLPCHSTQRPDLQPGTTAAAMASALNFDHSVNGTGDCIGCHGATVTANNYVNYLNPTTKALPGGDWKGGQPYPGSTFASSPDQSIQVTELHLVRDVSVPRGNVLTATNVTEVIYNGMLHTSTALPPALQAGPSNMPDFSKCWHCHTNNNGTVTAYRDGQYHSALTNYRATPNGPIVPFPQPTDQCVDCHANMMPDGIVQQQAGGDLWPMDHNTMVASPITLANGKVVNYVSDLDCSVCHKSPGTSWGDGVFHAGLPPEAVVSDCERCHYPIIADAAKASTMMGTLYAFDHLSNQLPFQTCQEPCHTTSRANRAILPATLDLWKPGIFHVAVAAQQPTACLDCHVVSQPAANVPTQSSVVYALTRGGTGSNGGQWMNHGSPPVTGKDCAVCHLAEATATVTATSAWSQATAFHAAVPTGVQTCRECHGLVNGGGGMVGTKNNMPVGLTYSTTTTTATAASGVINNTPAMISHADVNVTRLDCNACHTQVGPSAAASLHGSEWTQARFHGAFSAQNPLVMNTTTGRCSNCHLAEKPPVSYPMQNHSAFTAAPSTTDCSACHSYPGSGAGSAPNWLGSVGGAPVAISVGGFVIPSPPGAGATLQAGIFNLPHPTAASGFTCTDCHSSPTGGRKAIGYDHKSSLIKANCSSCHEAGSDMVSTVWNAVASVAAGAGDTRPFTLTGLVPSTNGNTRALSSSFNHFYPVDCHECHDMPGTGTGASSAGTAYRAAWRLDHTQANMTNPSTCNMCHAAPNDLPEK